MTLYTFNQNNGPDFALNGYTLDAFEAHASAESAAYTMLGYDCQSSGIEERDGEFVPWRRRMNGRVEYLTNLAGGSEDEAVKNIIGSPHFVIECVSEETALRIIEEAKA